MILTLASAAAWGPSKATAGRSDGPLDSEARHLRAWFPGGIGIQFDTESTGPNSPVGGNGSLVVDDQGTYRVLQDRSENALFAYVIDAFSAPNGTVTIRIKPIPQDLVAKAKARPQSGPLGRSNSPMPTVSGIREFTGLQRGQAVRLDVLSNSATGETIYDILRPTTEAPPGPNFSRGADSAPAREELSFRDVTLKVNGRAAPSPEGWLTGAAARLYIPGLGAYYIAAYELKLQQTFRHAVNVEQKRLAFSIDGDLVEIESQSNALTRSDRGIVWVYHDPNFKTSLNPAVSDVMFADAVEYLMTKR